MHPLAPEERQRVYACLQQGAVRAASSGAPIEERWNWLMAAHVVGQHEVALHFDSHRRMLSLARATDDRRETIGQLVRIALLPFGHLLRQIPVGNIGRSTVGVTARMEPPEPVQVLIDWAVLGTRIPGTGW